MPSNAKSQHSSSLTPSGTTSPHTKRPWYLAKAIRDYDEVPKDLEDNGIYEHPLVVIILCRNTKKVFISFSLDSSHTFLCLLAGWRRGRELRPGAGLCLWSAHLRSVAACVLSLHQSWGRPVRHRHLILGQLCQRRVKYILLLCGGRQSEV